VSRLESIYTEVMKEDYERLQISGLSVPFQGYENKDRRGTHQKKHRILNPMYACRMAFIKVLKWYVTIL